MHLFTARNLFANCILSKVEKFTTAQILFGDKYLWLPKDK